MLAALFVLTSALLFPYGTSCECSGISPNGIEWCYVIPEHTGTKNVVSLLHERDSKSNCKHNHLALHEEDPSRFFTFSFVSPPQHRVVSSYVYHDRNSVKSKLNQNKTEEVKKNFRSWACSEMRLAEVGLNKSIMQITTGHGQDKGHIPHSIRSFFITGSPPNFIGRTANLNEDFNELMEILGYSYVVVEKKHSISSGLSLSWSQYYDDETRACVDSIYACDLPIVAHAEASRTPYAADWMPNPHCSEAGKKEREQNMVDPKKANKIKEKRKGARHGEYKESKERQGHRGKRDKKKAILMQNEDY